MERRRGANIAKYSHKLDNSSGNESNYDSQQETESNDDEEYSPSGRARRTYAKRLVNSSERENGGVRRLRRGSPGRVGGGDKVNRMPTRRPDPNIFNRNALMARENRRKKKELMEQLEREVFELREKSKKLHRSLFKQSATIKSLKQENKYLQNVIGNQTEIVKLLKTLNSSRLPITSSMERMTTLRRGGGHPSPDSSTLILEKAPEMKEEDDSGDDCLEMQLSPSSEWDEMYPLCFDKLAELPDDIESSSANRVSINSEHNYFNQHLDHKNNAGVDIGSTGVCLHVASGKVSLEFCATCHINALDSWTQD